MAPSGGSVDNLKLVLGSHSPSELKCINDLILKEIFKKSEEQASLGTKPIISNFLSTASISSSSVSKSAMLLNLLHFAGPGVRIPPREACFYHFCNISFRIKSLIHFNSEGLWDPKTSFGLSADPPDGTT